MGNGALVENSIYLNELEEMRGIFWEEKEAGLFGNELEEVIRLEPAEERNQG